MSRRGRGRKRRREGRGTQEEEEGLYTRESDRKEQSKGVVKDVLAIPDEWVMCSRVGAIIGKGGIVLKNIMSATDTR
eukprot:748071-Hanusia_phi.AAC.4